MCIKFEFDVYLLLSFDRRVLDTQPIDTGSLTFECVCTLGANSVTIRIRNVRVHSAG